MRTLHNLHMLFVGASCTHSDYKPPPLSALRSLVDGHVVNKVEDTHRVVHICHDTTTQYYSTVMMHLELY